MWSEHCSYKSSRVHLAPAADRGPRVLVGPGENAGVIDAGDGIAVAIRIESHNHPSAIEPYQGAATGVGGILRDIFTMGARPLARHGPAVLRSARRAPPAVAVRGGGRGASRATATRSACRRSAASSPSTPCYASNPLVNVLCLGALPVDRLVLGRGQRARATWSCCSASSTGRDGIGGVSVLASAGFAARSGARCADDAKRPSVQVGDPYEEKRLIEACLELLDAAPGGRHPGPRRRRAGLRHQRDGGPGGVGMDVDVSAVPRREPGDGALGGHDEREPGADAGHRHARRTGRGRPRSAAAGRSGPRWSGG